MQGEVIKNTGSWYVVRTDDGLLFDCKMKGNFRLKGIRSTNPVAVGDRVTLATQAEGPAFITSIEPRRNYIIRKASNLSKQSHILAANIDLLCLIATVSHPETSTTFIDRVLASAEAYRIPALIVFNKTDCYAPEEQRLLESRVRLYTEVGYTCLPCSALQGEGVDTLRQALSGRTTLLSGHSGVGKSTLLNALIPQAAARTAPISSAHDTGMHTTTFSEMFDLPGGGRLIDTPGIKGFGTFDMEPQEVGHYFREIFATATDCRYSDCTNTHEPGCAVLRAVEEQRISLSRYQSYLSMLDDKDEDKYRIGY